MCYMHWTEIKSEKDNEQNRNAIGFDLREGRRKTREKSGVKNVTECACLIVANATTRFVSKTFSFTYKS